MSSRRSHRPRKSIDYSKLSTDKEDVDQDDDDFITDTPTKKRKEDRKRQNESQGSSPYKNKTASIERKARNRLSEEEKYNKQLEEALKLSIIDSSKNAADERSSNKDKGISQNDACVPLTVRVEVMDSPVSRQRRNMEVTENKENLNVTKCIRNGAILPGSDQITPAPTKDITAKPLKSQRSRTATTTQEDDEYQLSEDSESNEDDDETYDDFQDVVSVKSKKKAASKSRVEKENKTTFTTNIAAKCTLKSRKLMSTPSPGKVSSDTRNKCEKLMPSPCPVTPKSNNVLTIKSPSLVQRKFIQRGWTPPGPADAKTIMLKSSPTPGCIRVGLSRNARISPLHPRTIMR